MTSICFDCVLSDILLKVVAILQRQVSIVHFYCCVVGIFSLYVIPRVCVAKMVHKILLFVANNFLIKR